jgi:hypothetical protein
LELGRVKITSLVNIQNPDSLVSYSIWRTVTFDHYCVFLAGTEVASEPFMAWMNREISLVSTHGRIVVIFGPVRILEHCFIPGTEGASRIKQQVLQNFSWRRWFLDLNYDPHDKS